MMADRNVMTLPLRKRKHYMNEGDASNGNSAATAAAAAAAANGSEANAGGGGNNNGSSKVMRMSSVIQFAKAS